jgi:hypothetical protein
MEQNTHQEESMSTRRYYRHYRHHSVNILLSDDEFTLLDTLCRLLRQSRRDVLMDGLQRVNRSDKVRKLRAAQRKEVFDDR